MWLCGEMHAQSAHDFFRRVVQQIDRPAESVQKPVKGPRDEQRHSFCARQAQALGNQFTQHDLQHRQQAESDRQRDAVRDQRGPRATNFLHQRAQNAGECDFAQIPERKARERDAHLHAGNHPAQIGKQAFDDLRARVALFHQLTYARLPHGNQREFSGGEKRVDAHQRQHREKLQGDHRESPSLAARLRASAQRSIIPLEEGCHGRTAKEPITADSSKRRGATGEKRWPMVPWPRLPRTHGAQPKSPR